jgi:hypothetical protein
MSSLSFDRYGNLVPYEISIIRFETFRQFFVKQFEHSIARGVLYELYLEFVKDFGAEFTPEFVHWIGGSFVTQKLNPNDIDVVTLVEVSETFDINAPNVKKFTTKGYSKENYAVDSYMIPVYDTQDIKYFITQEAVIYWKNWLSHDREYRKKGFIQLNYSKNE